jgi:DNA-binding response OmpR family regulator
MTQKAIHILYAEADAERAHEFISHMNERGYKHIKHFENGADLEQTYLENPGRCDLIIIHHHIPGVEGMIVLENLRAAGHTVPCIVLSSDIFLEDKIKQSGVYIWDQDSHHMNKIVDAIQSLLTGQVKSRRKKPDAPPPEPPPA